MISKGIIMNNYAVNLIFWENTASTYLYGSSISFLSKEHVTFANNLMSPGKKIVEWYSQTNYQAQRFCPQLPLLTPKHSYVLRLRARTEPAKSVLVRLSFYNHGGQLIEQKFISGFQGEFVYPTMSASYSIALLNAGCQKINFQRLELMDSRYTLPQNDNFFFSKFDQGEISKLHIFFLEPTLKTVELPIKINLEKRIGGNILLIGSSFINAHLYIDSEVKSRILAEAKSAEMIFYGAGPISNFAACYYSKLFSASNKLSKRWFTTEQYLNIVQQEQLPIVAAKLINLLPSSAMNENILGDSLSLIPPNLYSNQESLFKEIQQEIDN
ncbi:MAG: accessory Sec system protein Asp3 [Liquorilactobacillus nagelii]